MIEMMAKKSPTQGNSMQVSEKRDLITESLINRVNDFHFDSDARVLFEP